MTIRSWLGRDASHAGVPRQPASPLAITATHELEACMAAPPPISGRRNAESPLPGSSNHPVVGLIEPSSHLPAKRELSPTALPGQATTIARPCASIRPAASRSLSATAWLTTRLPSRSNLLAVSAPPPHPPSTRLPPPTAKNAFPRQPLPPSNVRFCSPQEGDQRTKNVDDDSRTVPENPPGWPKKPKSALHDPDCFPSADQSCQRGVASPAWDSPATVPW